MRRLRSVVGICPPTTDRRYLLIEAAKMQIKNTKSIKAGSGLTGLAVPVPTRVNAPRRASRTVGINLRCEAAMPAAAPSAIAPSNVSARTGRFVVLP